MRAAAVFLGCLVALVRAYSNDDLLSGLYKQLMGYVSGYGLQNVPDFSYTVSDWNVNSWEDSYDFIIVGSGSAGSVLANRLSEIADWKILLLEAGKPESVLSAVPVLVPMVQLTPYNWDYLMEYQPNFAKGMIKNRLGWPRGRALGGTSVINYMIYTRGNPRDFERWAAEGNPGWSYRDVLPYYLKSENSKVRYTKARFHGKSGPWSVEDTHQTPLTAAFIGGGAELGYHRVDYTTDDQIGFGTVQANIRSGERQSVARAFLEPVRYRRNLHICTSARVTKVLIRSGVAYGVEFLWDGRLHRSFATKEVVLSAGAFVSPQLLMLSGIGPKQHLDDLKIDVIQDSPVGQNLHDHITYIGLNFLINQDVGVSLLKSMNPVNILRWLTKRDGMLTSLGGVSGIAYIKTSADTDPDRSFPDVELIFVDGTIGSDFYITAKGMKIRPDVYKKYWEPIQLLPKWTIFPMLLHPKSTGYLKLRSTNPLDAPIFVGNYFTDPERHDLRTMIASIRFVQKLAATAPFRRFDTRLYNTSVPGCEYYAYDSDRYWQCALETLSITLHHQVGTCRMGAVGDPRSVVDSELRVIGVRNLRVADTSVIPFAITAHTNAPSVMVGERASDFIKHAWGEG